MIVVVFNKTIIMMKPKKKDCWCLFVFYLLLDDFYTLAWHDGSYNGRQVYIRDTFIFY